MTARVRSFARSHVMSDPIEKCAGAGEEPKGSLVRRIPVSVPLRLGHTAMHLLAILGVVCIVFCMLFQCLFCCKV